MLIIKGFGVLTFFKGQSRRNIRLTIKKIREYQLFREVWEVIGLTQCCRWMGCFLFWAVHDQVGVNCSCGLFVHLKIAPGGLVGEWF